jgi:hypothetical protein
MKRTLVIATAAALIGTVVGTYLFMKRKRNIDTPTPLTGNKSHHLTNVFADAKNHMRNIKTEES